MPDGRPSSETPSSDTPSIEECERALRRLARRLADAGPAAGGTAGFDRTLSCRLSDPQVSFAGRLRDGALTELRTVGAGEAAAAKVRLRMSGVDLIRLVDGELNLAGAWASGRVKIEAGVLDLMKLRSLL
jgi:hypothetical protein